MNISNEVERLEIRHEGYRRIMQFLLLHNKYKLKKKEFETLKPYLQKAGLNKHFRGCPFPFVCVDYNKCNKSRGCNYDTCSNGHCYRMS